MFDVPGNESGHFAAGGTLRFDQQSKFRGAAGARWKDSSGESNDGGGGGDCRAFHGYSGLEVSMMEIPARLVREEILRYA
jgi:hypothetical protein